MAEKIHIVGIGDDGLDGLTDAARRLVEQANVLIGSKQTLAAVPASSAERLETGGDLEVVVQWIDARKEKSITVLTSGDPMFYGIARYLCDQLGKDRFEVVPHVSSMQLAFARVKESWDEAYLADLSRVELGRAIDKIRSAERAGLFTNDDVSPAQVANALMARGIDYFQAYVCENLGSPDECVTQGSLSELSDQAFGPLNVMVLVRHSNTPDQPLDGDRGRLFGNADESFRMSKPKRGLLTPVEVRCIALAIMNLRHNSIVWDIGAGSGSVSIEAARIAREGTTYAVEMDSEDFQLIQENCQTFAVTNVHPILGKAPDALADLPDPDAVFVGGTGRAVGSILQQVAPRLRPNGTLVVNTNSIDNLANARSVLAGVLSDVSVRMVQVAHGTEQMNETRFESSNPTFLISATKAN